MMRIGKNIYIYIYNIVNTTHHHQYPSRICISEEKLSRLPAPLSPLASGSFTGVKIYPQRGMRYLDGMHMVKWWHKYVDLDGACMFTICHLKQGILGTIVKSTRHTTENSDLSLWRGIPSSFWLKAFCWFKLMRWLKHPLKWNALVIHAGKSEQHATVSSSGISIWAQKKYHSERFYP